MKKDFGFLGPAYQLSLLHELMFDSLTGGGLKKFGERIIGVLEINYFDNVYARQLVSIIKNYHEKYEKIPGSEAIEAAVRIRISDEITQQSTLALMDQIRKAKVEDAKYVQEESLKFCLQQNLLRTIDKARQIIDKGDFQSYDKLEEMFRQALSAGADTDDAVEVFDDMDEIFAEEHRDTIPTGIKGLDKATHGGLGRGELGLCIAPSGVGKSTILSKIANTGYLFGANVLQIIFEDKVNDIKRKHVACISQVNLNDLHKEREKIIPIIERIKAKHAESGNKLYIKKFSSDGTTIGDIRNYVKRLASQGIIIDLLVLDYVDCVSLTKNSVGDYKEEAPVMRKLEALADEYHMAIWTATQGNRGSIEAEVVKTSDMGGYIKKQDPVHVIISIAKTLDQKESRQATISILKNRHGDDGLVFKDIVFDNGKLLIEASSTVSFIEFQKEVKDNQKAADEQRIMELVKKKREAERNLDEAAAL